MGHWSFGLETNGGFIFQPVSARRVDSLGNAPWALGHSRWSRNKKIYPWYRFQQRILVRSIPRSPLRGDHDMSRFVTRTMPFKISHFQTYFISLVLVVPETTSKASDHRHSTNLRGTDKFAGVPTNRLWRSRTYIKSPPIFDRQTCNLFPTPGVLV